MTVPLPKGEKFARANKKKSLRHDCRGRRLHSCVAVLQGAFRPTILAFLAAPSYDSPSAIEHRLQSLTAAHYYLVHYTEYMASRYTHCLSPEYGVH